MSPLRVLLHGFAALLIAVLFAATPASAQTFEHSDAAYALSDNAVQPPKLIDHSARRPRHTASLEEHFEIDDDSEQYFKLLPGLARPPCGFTLVVEPAPASYSNAPANHRACAAYPTGPPSA